MYLFEKFLRYKTNIKPYVSPSVPEVKIAAAITRKCFLKSAETKQLKYFSEICCHEML